MFNPSSTHSEKQLVEFYDCDNKMRQRPSHIVRRLQQMAENQLQIWDMSYEKMRSEHGMVFLLSKLILDIEQFPTSAQHVELKTCPMGSKGSQLLREGLVQGEDGQRLCSLYTTWTLYDVNAGRVVRPAACPIKYESGEISISTDSFKFRAEMGELVASRRVVYSDLDPNGHINNATYLDIICDTLPFERMEQDDIKQISIYYQQQAVAGDVLSIYMGQNEGEYSIVGQIGERPCFEGLVKF